MRRFVLYILPLLCTIFMISCDTNDDIGNGKNSNKNYDYTYTENYTDSLGAIYSNKGYIALFGYKEIPSVFDSHGEISTNKERIVYIAKVNEKSKEIDETDAIVAILDSTYFPVHIIGKEVDIVISRTDNDYANFLVYDHGTDNWDEFKNIKLSQAEQSVPDSALVAKSLSSGGSSIFTLSNAITALGLLTNIKGIIIKTGIEKLPPAIGMFGDIAGMAFDEIGLGVSVTVGGLPGAIVGLVGYGAAKWDKLKKRLFGDYVRISIEDIKQTDRNSFAVSYNVEGLNERGLSNSELFFSLLPYKTLKREVILLPVKNGFAEESESFKEKGAGTYEIYLTLMSNEYPIIRYITKPTVTFSIFDLNIEKYQVDDNPKYEDGAVRFNIDVYLSGDQNTLNGVKQFGYYTRFSNATPEYHPVSNLSSVFTYTQLRCELNIDKEGFFEENINYSTFEANAVDYHIGTYVVLKNGNIVHLDEKPIEGLIYKRKPAFNISNIKIIESVTYPVESYRNYTKYTVTFNVDGGLFVKELYGMYERGWEEAGTRYLTYNEYNDNKTFSIERIFYFYNGSNMFSASPIYFYATLENGSTYTFPNVLVCNDTNVYVDKRNNTRSISKTSTIPNNCIMPIDMN